MEQASIPFLTNQNSSHANLPKVLDDGQSNGQLSLGNNNTQSTEHVSDKMAKGNLKAVEQQKNGEIDTLSEHLSRKDSQVSQISTNVSSLTPYADDDHKTFQNDHPPLTHLNSNQDMISVTSKQSQQTNTTTNAVDGLDEDLAESWYNTIHWPSVTAGLFATIWPPALALLYEEVFFPNHPQDDLGHDLGHDLGIVGFVAIGAILGMLSLCCVGNRDAKKSVGMILIPTVVALIAELGFYRGYSGDIDHRAEVLRKRDRIIFYGVVGFFSSVASFVDTKCCTAEHYRQLQAQEQARLENRIMRNKVRSKKTKEQVGEMSLFFEELRSPNGASLSTSNHASNGIKSNNPLKSSAQYPNYTNPNSSGIGYNKNEQLNGNGNINWKRIMRQIPMNQHQAAYQANNNSEIQLQVSQNYKEAKEKEAEAKIAEAKISESKERRYNELKEAVGAVQAHQMVYGNDSSNNNGSNGKFNDQQV